MKKDLFAWARDLMARVATERAARFLKNPPSASNRNEALRDFGKKLEKNLQAIPKRVLRLVSNGAPRPEKLGQKVSAAVAEEFNRKAEAYWGPLREQLADLDQEAQDIANATLDRIEVKLESRLLRTSDPATDPQDHHPACHGHDVPLKGIKQILGAVEEWIGAHPPLYFDRHVDAKTNPIPAWKEAGSWFALPCRLEIWGVVESSNRKNRPIS